ncbi:hypothetical protein D3C75_1123270 [compost metagenome]
MKGRIARVETAMDSTLPMKPCIWLGRRWLIAAANGGASSAPNTALSPTTCQLPPKVSTAAGTTETIGI